MNVEQLFESIFGEYHPIEVENTVVVVGADGSETTTTTYETEVDFGYIGGVVMTLCVLWCALRMLGGILK